MDSGLSPNRISRKETLFILQSRNLGPHCLWGSQGTVLQTERGGCPGLGSGATSQLLPLLGSGRDALLTAIRNWGGNAEGALPSF